MTDLDNLTIQIGLTGQKYCKCTSLGVMKPEVLGAMIDLDVRLTINSSPSECAPVAIPIVVCPPSVTLQPEHKFIIGNPVPFTDILYGYYWFQTGNTNNPNAAALAADIALHVPNTPGTHYWTTQWNPLGTPAQILSPYICYHVIRLSNTTPIVQLYDEAGVKVNADWTVLSDSLYTYYLLARVIAPSDITYIVKQ